MMVAAFPKNMPTPEIKGLGGEHLTPSDQMIGVQSSSP